MDGISNGELLRKKMILRNQIMICLECLDHQDSWLQVDALTKNVEKIHSTATKYLPEDFSDFKLHFNTDLLFHRDFSSSSKAKGMMRIEELGTALSSLLGYLNMDLGDPYVKIIINNTLEEARDAIEKGYLPCAIFLTRIALEQGLKSLCRLRHVPYSEKDTAGDVNQKLFESDPSWKPYYLDVNTKLSHLNPSAHGDITLNEARIRALIDWADKFLMCHLSGRDESTGG